MYAVSTAFLAAVAASHKTAVKCEVWSALGAAPLATFSVVAGAVTIDRTRNVRRMATATVVDPTLALVPQVAGDLFTTYGNEVRFYRGVKYVDGSTEMVPLGVYGLTDVEVTEDQTGVSISLAGSDRSARVAQAGWTDPYNIPVGTELSAAVGGMLQNRLPGVPMNLTATSVTLPAMTFGALQSQGNSDPWTDMVTLMADAGYDLYFDATGTAVSIATPNTDATNAVLAIGPSDAKVILQAKRKITNSNTFNGYVVTGQGSGLAVPVRAVSWDMDQSSPTYRYGPFGERPTFYSSPAITTGTQAQSVSDSMLAKGKGNSEALEWEQIVNPALDAWDVIQTTIPNLQVRRYAVIDSLTIPLDAQTAMSAITRTTANLPIQIAVPVPSTMNVNQNAFTLQGSGAFTGAATTGAFTIPGSPTALAGDVLVYFMHEQGSSAQTYTMNRSVGVPTLVDFRASGNIACGVYVLKSADPGQTFTLTSSRTGQKSGEWLLLRNVSGGSLDAILDALSTTNGVAVQAPAITVGAHDAVITFHGIATVNTRTWTAPGGMTVGPTTDTGSNASGSASAAFYILDNGPAGTFGPATATSSSTNNVWTSVSVGIKIGMAAPPPPTRFPFQRGSSPGGDGNTTMTNMVALLGPQIVRAYEHDGVTPADWAHTVQAKWVPSGTPIVYSIKPDLTILGDKTNPSYASMISTWVAILGGWPDTVDNNWFCVHHEPEGDSGFTLAQFRAAQVNAANDIMPTVNAGRTHKIRYMTILQGATLQGFSGRSVGNYVDASVLAAVDGVGFDCYQYAQIQLAYAWSQANGNIPWAIPEHGCGGVPGIKDDQATANAMATDINYISGLPTAYQPVFDTWFNGAGTALDGNGSGNGSTAKPIAAATWKAAS